MSAITSNETALIIVKHVAARALQRLKANTIMTQLVNRSYEDVLANSGDTVNVPIPPSFAVNNLADGNAVVVQNPNHDRAQIVLNNHKTISFQVTDIARILSTPDVIDMDMGQAIANLAEAIDQSIIQAAYAGFTANTPVGAYGTPLSESTVLIARKTLVDSRVPKQAPKFGVVGTGAYNDLLGIGRFTEYQTRGPSAEQVGGSGSSFVDNLIGGGAISEGAVGKAHGILWFENQLVPVTGGNQTHNIVFSPDAILFAQRKLPVAPMGMGVIQTFVEEDGMALRVSMNYNADILGAQVTIDTLYGVGIGRNQFGVELRS